MPQHRLAAIMFTDISGYTSLMGRDEEKAFDILKWNKAIHERLIKKHNGTLIKEIGDGILAIFSLSSDAVRCAIALQKATADEDYRLRIGIHEGEIVFEMEDAWGNGVNIASRLQDLAQSNEILISEAIYKDIKNKAEFTVEYLAEKKLKNVDDPVHVYKVMFDKKTSSAGPVGKPRGNPKRKLLYWSLALMVIVIAGVIIRLTVRPGEKGTTARKSIAVMPFINDSNDSTNVYFINGLMESILNDLQMIGDLNVISRTSVEKYRNNLKTSPEIARELNVDYLIEGSGQKVNDRVMLYIQLIDARKDKHIWSHPYTREISDIFKLQMEVAKNIADHVQVIVSRDVEKRINKAPTTELTAYDYYLRARNSHTNYMMKGTSPLGQGPSQMISGNTEALNDAIRLYKKALEFDPAFARALAGLGLAYWNKSVISPEQRESLQDTVLQLADKALAINPQLDEAYYLKGIYYKNKGSHFQEALENLKKAIAINPNYATAYIEIGAIYVWNQPDFVEGLEYLYKAYDLDRSFMLSYTLNSLGNGYLFSGFDRQSRQYFEELFKLNNDTGLYYFNLAFVEWSMGNIGKSIEWATKEWETDSLSPKMLKRARAIEFLIERYSYTGNMDAAWRYLKIYFAEFHHNDFALTQKIINESPYDLHRIGYVLFRQGKKDLAREYFDKQVKLCLESVKRNDEGVSRGNTYYDLFAIYSFLGEKEKAFHYLELLQDKKYYPNWLISYFKYDPLIDSVRNDPRFRNFLQQAEDKFELEHEKVRSWLKG